jgi:serine/threonine protein kinase
LVQRQAPMNVDRGLSIMSAVFAALDYVHSRRLVHRDVKTENVFIGKSGIPVLGDFGIAACLDDPEELAKPSGTPGYAAPEIILAKPYGQKVDIFACGVVLYFMLSKMMPFTGNDILTVVRKTAACKVKFSHATFGHVKSSVLFMLKALLEREEEQRPAACDAFRGTQLLLGDNQDKGITEALECWRLKQQEAEREQEKKLKPIGSKGALPTQDSVPTCCKKMTTMVSRESEVIPLETDEEHSHVGSKQTDEASQKTSTFASRLRQRVSRGTFFKGAGEIAGTPRSSTSAVTHSSTGLGQRSVRSKVSSVSSLSEDMLPPPPDNQPALLPIHPPATPKADGQLLLSTPRRRSFLSFLRIS